MKNFLRTFCFLVAGFFSLMTICGCSEELYLPAQTVVEEGEFSVDFQVELPQQEDGTSTTRSFGENLADSKNARIFLLAFDENHFLTNVYEAKFESSNREDGVLRNVYTVTMKTSEAPRYFHMLVNYNDLDMSKIPYGTESDIFGSDLMTVGLGTDVYWERVYLDKVDKETVKKKLSKIKLIRNFCKLNLILKTADENGKSVGTLVDAKWGMGYVPTRSFVAPFLKDQEFADYLREKEDGTTYIVDYDALTDDGYTGHIPRKAGNTNFYSVTSDFEDSVEWVSIDTPIYSFENESSSSSSLFERSLIFLRGKFKDASGNVDEKESYYRLSLVDPKNNYELLNMLRNIQYKITISSISSTGYETADIAAERPANNNLSGSTVTASYPTVVSDVSSLRVDYLKKYIMSPDAFSLTYRYVPDVKVFENGDYVTDNEKVVIKTLTGDNLAETITPDIYCDVTDSEVSSVLSQVKMSSTDEDNFRTAYFLPNKNNFHVGGLVETAYVRVSVTENPSLYRDIEFILRGRYLMENMELIRDNSYVGYNMDGTQSVGSDSCYVLKVDIPTGIPDEIFPLDFTLESQPTLIYPNVTRSVMEVNGSHVSIFDQSVKNSFHYHRAVAGETYNTVRTAHGYGGFVEKNNKKQITFFFRLNDSMLPFATKTDSNGKSYFLVRLGVYNDVFSSDPDADLTATFPHILEAYYKFTKDNTYYTVSEVEDTTKIKTDSSGFFYLEE